MAEVEAQLAARKREAIADAQKIARLLPEAYLDFRHKFRPIYGFDLDFKKWGALDQIYPETHRQFVSDINKFIKFLNGLVKEFEQSSSDSR
ncbi:MAG: hypothetical protein ONB46_07890 [candidate division KSB1 bacterium]|nr:hypothetical protein [candidate division KSB1 bacterium]MDZ7365810.1 hypothetical protein [candidate division KSB1 bacterium]MDZ7403711.1 hypothetical protein [candidate division KSB1 bacterium]